MYIGIDIAIPYHTRSRGLETTTDNPRNTAAGFFKIGPVRRWANKNPHAVGSTHVVATVVSWNSKQLKFRLSGGASWRGMRWSCLSPSGFLVVRAYPFFFFLEPEGRSRVPQQNRQKMDSEESTCWWILLELAILAEDFGSWMVSWRSWLTFVKGFSAKWHWRREDPN